LDDNLLGLATGLALLAMTMLSGACYAKKASPLNARHDEFRLGVPMLAVSPTAVRSFREDGRRCNAAVDAQSDRLQKPEGRPVARATL